MQSNNKKSNKIQIIMQVPDEHMVCCMQFESFYLRQMPLFVSRILFPNYIIIVRGYPFLNKER